MVLAFSRVTINKYLDNKYKVYTSKNKNRKPKIPAIERVENKYGKDFAERLEQEVIDNQKKPRSEESRARLWMDGKPSTGRET